MSGVQLISPQDEGQRHVMSVDVEDYFQVWALQNAVARQDWDSFELRVETSTRQVMALFERCNAKATFFTLGWVAEKCPSLIRDIVAAGHEIASHGYEHIKVFDQTPEAFKEDAGRTKEILEDISGVRVKGYRAAGFSIDASVPWAHEVLASLGYLYSSSVHPIAHDHYSAPDFPRFAYRPVEGSEFLEIPVSTVSMMNRRFSCAGGGWFRAMPSVFYQRLIEKLIRKEQKSAIFYFHPWEIDHAQPRFSEIPLKSKIRHYLNLSRMEAKLQKLLERYEWTSFEELYSMGEGN